MKIGIVGDAARTSVWEKFLRHHNIVKEVILSPGTAGLENIDACFLLDDNQPARLEPILTLIQKGIHTFFVGRWPHNTPILERIERTSLEGNAFVQFSHWPSLAASTNWMQEVVSKPDFIIISKEVDSTLMGENFCHFDNFWTDEVGFCLKFMQSNIHHLEAKNVQFTESEPYAIHIFMRFENGGTASIYQNIASEKTRHIRTIHSKNMILECDVLSQEIRQGVYENRFNVNKSEFEGATSAERAALLFLKAIQMKRNPQFTVHDAISLSKAVEKIKKRLHQF